MTTKRIAALFIMGLMAWTTVAGAEPLPVRPIDDILNDAKTYTFGGDRTPLSELEQAVFAAIGNDEAEEDLAETLAKYLNGDVSIDTRRFVVRQLRLIGNEDTVPTLKKLLADPDLCHLAAYALEPIPGAKATNALEWGLNKADARDKAGIAAVLGSRGSDDAVSALKKALKNDELEVQQAVAMALGTIGGSKAAEVLQDAHGRLEGEARKAMEDGLVLAAKSLITDDKEAADAIYIALYEGSDAPGIKSAALTGLAATRGAEALPILLAAVDSQDAYLTQVAVHELQTLDAPGVTGALVERAGKFGPEADVLILKALSLRGDAAGRGTALSAAADPDARVRMAALDALSTLGDASCVPVLIEGAVKGDRSEQEAARTTLAVLPGDNVNHALMELVNTATVAPVRAEAIRALGSRDAQEAVPLMFQVGGTRDALARDAALDTLGMICGPEHLADLIDAQVRLNGSDVQANAEKAVVEVASKIPMDQQPAAALVTAMNAGGSTDIQCSLLNAIGRIGDPSALDEVRAAADGGNKPVKRAAVQALTDWPTPATVNDLAAIAESAKDDEIKDAAFKGLLQQLRAPNARPIDETIALYQRAIALAKTADARKALLSGLAEVRDAKALALIEPFAADAEVSNEAKAAADKVRAAIQPQQ